MKLSSELAETTLGTDPWGSDQTLFDRTQWHAREQALGGRFQKIDAALERLVRESTEERRRLYEVIERLQSRVYELEDELDRQRKRRGEARRRLQELTKVIEGWKTNEP
ncbi:MAG: hypothetical protein D6761_12790 [Candidatus Dadabacteria bacterium]|nr:MAG: hypothetical protein D6761_12790 [Candidatus Dadabacteria bacterium]